MTFGAGGQTTLLKPISPCATCLGYSWGHDGYVPASGTGENGVLVVAEAAGAHEAKEGLPLVGDAGYYLWSQLRRVGIEREGFKCHNVLSCRPPDNKLAKAPYESQVIEHCAPLLDETIREMRSLCQRTGRTFVILTLGRIAFKRIMDLRDGSPILREDYLNYPFWSERYGAWCLAADHPSYLQRGYHHLVPVLQFAFKRALEIAANGLQLEEVSYVLDPDPATFSSWVDDYLRVALLPTVYLSYDIETPYKQGKSEDQVDAADEADASWTILRTSFAYQPGRAVSVPWRADYLPSISRIFDSAGNKFGWNSDVYDNPRIRRHCPIRGLVLDGMVAWHVLNSALPKSLGFVTPFHAQKTSMWKHLSSTEPAFYNAKDADMALRCLLGTMNDLKENDQGPVFDTHIVQANRVFTYMSEQGLEQDMELRQQSEDKLSAKLETVNNDIKEAVPPECREEQVFKRLPGSFEGVLHRVTSGPGESVCGACGLLSPPKVHFGKKKPCKGAEVIEVPALTYYRPTEWKVSMKSMTAYQAVNGHKPITFIDRDTKEKKVTFNEDAINRLVKLYPKDALYPRILDHRELQKLLGTYIGHTEAGRIVGGMPVGPDGRIHTIFTRNPSTLRSASQDPNLQNLPRPKGVDDYATIIRNLIRAGTGHIFTARDYSGIEAVLVGYFALAPRYIRLAKLDVHSYYTAYALYEIDGRISANDLPLLSWDDDKLARRLADIKKEFKRERNDLYKHLVHGNNFMQGAFGTQQKVFHETGYEPPISVIRKVQSVYFELFPEIPTWHSAILAQANHDGYLRNPFNYVHRFSRAYKWRKVGGKWEHKPGEQANEAIAFLPQSSAMGIIVEAMLRLFFERFEEAGQYLRLLVHDELFSEAPEELVGVVDGVMKEEMEKPIKAMPLPAEWGMGSHLTILTEAKRGKRWGEMQ
jgi:uracil-DNA glycosylase family 4